MTVCSHPILVVDDDPDIRASLKDILEDEGYSVHEAGNGREALAALQTVTPCVILLDWMMPVMDGLEFLEARKGTPAAKVPVIVVTAAQPSARFENVARVLHKPLSLLRLFESIAEHCSHR